MPFDATQLRQALLPLSWSKVRLAIRNRRARNVQEPPLGVLYGLLERVAAQVPEQLKCVHCHHPVRPLPGKVREGLRYELELVFATASEARVTAFIEVLAKVLHLEDRNHSLDAIQGIERRNLELLESECPLNGRTEACLEFVTPFQYAPCDKQRPWMLNPPQLLEGMCRRIGAFFGPDAASALPDCSRLGEQLRTLPYYWHYEEYPRHSKSTRKEQWLRGMRGPLYLRGELEAIAPLLLLCSELHATQRRAAWGMGYYQLVPERPFLDAELRSKRLFATTLEKLQYAPDFADALETVTASDDAFAALQQRFLDPRPITSTDWGEKLRRAWLLRIAGPGIKRICASHPEVRPNERLDAENNPPLAWPIKQSDKTTRASNKKSLNEVLQDEWFHDSLDVALPEADTIAGELLRLSACGKNGTQDSDCRKNRNKSDDRLLCGVKTV